MHIYYSKHLLTIIRTIHVNEYNESGVNFIVNVNLLFVLCRLLKEQVKRLRKCTFNILMI